MLIILAIWFSLVVLGLSLYFSVVISVGIEFKFNHGWAIVWNCFIPLIVMLELVGGLWLINVAIQI